MKIKSTFIQLSFMLFCLVILLLSVRGLSGNPSSKELNTPEWVNNGPFELSPERGRYALTYSLVEDKSFQFSKEIGNFAVPDVAVSDGRFVSLFAPLVSVIAIPGYIIGKYFGIAQVGSFAVVSLFALLNVILLRLIAIRLGAGKIPATVASLLFVFGTPAYTYAVSLYQHHISTFLILLSLYVLIKSDKVWSLLVIFLLCAISLPLDYPNVFFMFPIGLVALGRIISIKKHSSNISLNVHILKFLTPLIMIVPITFFLLFNQLSYGNPLQIAGTLPSSKSAQTTNSLEAISKANKLAEQDDSDKKSAIGFFETRELVNGFYIHFISPDRGILYYTPIMLFGLIGIFFAYRKNVVMIPLLTAIIGANVLLYSMWGDPWGGWAFGSRYLIPTYAILSIFIALLLTYWSKKIYLLIAITIVAFYSIAVNTLGAITTSALPPQAEVLSLEKISGVVQKYTYARNWDYLLSGNSSSYVYQTFIERYVSPLQFYLSLASLICVVVGGLIIYHFFFSRKGEEHV